MMAQRLLLFRPERVVGLVLLNVAYRAPAEANAEQANAMLVQYTGLPRLAYQQFFISPQARQLMESNLESTFSALHGSDEGTKNFMEDLLCHHVSIICLDIPGSFVMLSECQKYIQLMQDHREHLRNISKPASDSRSRITPRSLASERRSSLV